MLLASETVPKALLKSPWVLERRELSPVAVLLLPTVLKKSALPPIAVLLAPVVLLTSAPVPRLVLLCAAATPAKESEKRSAAITMEKNDAVLVQLRSIQTSLFNNPLNLSLCSKNTAAGK